VPALRWADIGSDHFGVAVLNNSKYGFDALGSRLRAHVIRTSYEPDPVSDRGRADHSSFAIVPHLGTWADAGIPRLAAAFNTSVPARFSTGPASTGPAEPAPDWRPRLVDEGTVVIAALKYAHRGEGTRVIRLYESAGRHAATRLAGLPADAVVYDATPVETPLRRLAAHHGTVDLTFRPFQVRTLLVD
ncbi:MAG TPA: glycoside hydrolase family 38 C-terminal domain-containing protein, partial [Acidimicrobiales bacterium]